MSEVFILTKAYNSEKTLRRTIESVLSQTYSDFNYYIINNGSQDDTEQVIDMYSQKDPRIIKISREINIKKSEAHEFAFQISEEHGSDGFFCTLDSDDEYKPDFLEKMLVFVTENNFDVATCGTDWVDSETGGILKHKVIDNSLILEGKEFAEHFPVYRNFMVTAWGAIYSLDLLKKCDFKWAKNAMNFSDTAFCMEAFRRAKRAGVFAESLHNYYISPQTASYHYNPKWFLACKNLMEITKQYLLDYGRISRQNEDYLHVILLILIKYILPRIQNSDIGLSEKLNHLYIIIKDEMTQYMLAHWEEVGINSSKAEFLRAIKGWITSQNEWKRYYSISNEIIAAMNIGEED